MKNYDKSIIDLYISKIEPPCGLVETLASSTSYMKGTGEFILVKSESKIINWFRKLTKTEKYRGTFTFTYKIIKQ